MNRRPEDIRKALDAALSGASHDPTLFHRVVNASKGDSPPVKRKLTLSMALVLILALMTGTAAVAATYRGVSWFLTERENQTVDAAYLMDILEQHHDSELLDIRVVDAYWDGAKLSMAINFAPRDATLSLGTYCHHYEGQAAHQCRNETLDLLLDIAGTGIKITAGAEDTRSYGASYDYYCEEDDSLTIMITFGVNDMSQPVSVMIPFRTVLRSTGKAEENRLSCYLPPLADPIAPHEHNWAPATCVSLETCTICGRTQGGLGKHNFQPEACHVTRTCDICTYSYEAAHSINPDTGSCYCGVIH
ncbi:MAG: hypothetical protein IJB81_01125 [Clostridia bacterium]|nr:hypothetical protein [Clostridia bacterium]